MTELEEFLTALYDSLAEAEIQALQHGHQRLEEALDAGVVPEDASLPVYHATNIEVDLDVGLKARIENDRTKLVITEQPESDETPSGLRFGVEVFELLDRADLERSNDDRPNDRDRPTVTHRVPFERPTFVEADSEDHIEEQIEERAEGRADERADERAEGRTDERTDEPTGLTALTGIGEAKETALREAGFETLDDIRTASRDDLVAVEGIWADLATSIIEEAENRTRHERE